MININITENTAHEVLRGLIALEAQEAFLAHQAETAEPYEGRAGDVMYHRHLANCAHEALRQVQAQVPREYWPSR